MKAFWISLFFGALQMLMLFAVMTALNRSRKGLMWLLLFVKLLAYAAAIGILMNKYSHYIVFCFCGFLVGLPMCALVLYILKLFVMPNIKGKKLVIRKKLRITKN